MNITLSLSITERYFSCNPSLKDSPNWQVGYCQTSNRIGVGNDATLDSCFGVIKMIFRSPSFVPLPSCLITSFIGPRLPLCSRPVIRNSQCNLPPAASLHQSNSLGRAVYNSNGNGNGLARDLDIVITHTSADFDSLAAAVGLAKLHGSHTLVVTPGGESPSLRRFLSLHRQLYQIIDAKAVDPHRLRWVGVVDTVRKDRLGIAAEWPSLAEEVVVFDHHIGRQCDITNDRKIDIFVEPVGAVATLICERLMRGGHHMTPAEATLLALAIHSDTGSLTFEHTTQRDAAALTWLLQQGAIQRSIAEFTHTFLTDEQQTLLSQGLSSLNRCCVEGVEVGSLCIVGRTFLKGMSAVASDLLDIANLDVLILAYINCRGRRAKRKPITGDAGAACGPEDLKQVSIIGRARARVDGVDFNALFASIGGGGHARAASASLKATEAEADRVVRDLVEKAKAQIPEARPVSETMSTLLITVSPDAPIRRARALMEAHSHQILPVIDENVVLQGLVTVQDVKLAERRRGEEAYDTPVSAWLHHKVATVTANTPFHIAEKILSEDSLGMVPVVDDNNVLLGVVTRTDVLVARRLWPEKLKVGQSFEI